MSKVPDARPDAWGMKCTCEARSRFVTYHNGRCDLFRKFPADGRIVKKGGVR